MLYAWGDNKGGQLGIPPKPPSCPAVELSAAGVANHWQADGSRYQKREDEQRLPVPVPALSAGVRVVAVSTSEFHTLFLDALGLVYACGRNREGQLGLGMRSNGVNTPTRIGGHFAVDRITKAIKSCLKAAVVVAAGALHSLALSSTGELYAWGMVLATPLQQQQQPETENTISRGRLPGLADIVERWNLQYHRGGEDIDILDINNLTLPAVEKRLQATPAMVAGLPGKNAVNIAAGFSFSLVALSDGTAYAFGYSDKGQLGCGDRIARAELRGLDLRFNTAGQDEFITHIACGRDHAVAVTEAGNMYSWGFNAFGQLGCKSSSVLIPQRVMVDTYPMQQQRKVTHAACGTFFTCAVLDDGSALSWGHNEYGQLGECAPPESDRQGRARCADAGAYTANNVRLQSNERTATVACGNLHTIAMTQTGRIYAWGWNEAGCLGIDSRTLHSPPQEIPGFDDDDNTAVHIAAGGKRSFAIAAGEIGTSNLLPLYLATLDATNTDSTAADVCFAVGRAGTRVFAHCVIIHARCPRLAAIIAFSTRFIYLPVVGPPNSDIILPEYELEAFRAVMEYIYTDSVSLKGYRLAHKVAEAAKRLQLPRLSALCRRVMTRRDATRKVSRVPKSTFVQDMRERGLQGWDQDVRFISRQHPEWSLDCHRLLLRHVGDYFHGLFREGTFQEGSAASGTQTQLRSAEVDTETMSLEAFETIVDFAYTADTGLEQADVQTALQIFIAADRYGVKPLREQAELHVVDLVDDDNVHHLLEAAQRYGALRLEFACSQRNKARI
eukprot:jgi/Chlat1/8057/Chrsp73S09194